MFRKKKNVLDAITKLNSNVYELLNQQRERIFTLREENSKLAEELKAYKQKEKEISLAILTANEKLSSCEQMLEMRKNLELARLREFSQNWQRYFEKLFKMLPENPNMQRVAAFNRQVENILSPENNAAMSIYSAETVRLERQSQNIMYESEQNQYAEQKPYSTNKYAEQKTNTNSDDVVATMEKDNKSSVARQSLSDNFKTEQKPYSTNKYAEQKTNTNSDDIVATMEKDNKSSVARQSLSDNFKTEQKPYSTNKYAEQKTNTNSDDIVATMEKDNKSSVARQSLSDNFKSEQKISQDVIENLDKLVQELL